MKPDNRIYIDSTQNTQLILSMQKEWDRNNAVVRDVPAYCLTSFCDELFMPVIDIDKEAKSESNAIYRASHKEKIAAYQKKWREAHPDYNKEYRERNAPTIKAYRWGYYQKNKVRLAARARELYHLKKAGSDGA